MYFKEHTETVNAYINETNTQMNLIFFIFSSYKDLMESFRKGRSFTFGTFSLKRFPNKELNMVIKNDVEKRECVIVGSISPPEINLVSFLFLAHTLKKENAEKVIALLPYLAYSRADKKEPQKSYAASLVGELLAVSGIDKVVTVDVHSPIVKQLFPIPLISLSTARIFAQEIEKLNIKDLTIVAPDKGSIKRAEAVKNEAKIKREIAYFVKERKYKDVKVLEFYGKIGKSAVIIDDILDTGKTLISCCENLREKNVSEVYIMVTHGQFTGKEWTKLWGLGVKRIYCTDTIPLPKDFQSKNISVLSIAPMLTEYFKNISTSNSKQIK